MVPSDLTPYFAACSAVAGTLIGLLFVSITLRYDAIFGDGIAQSNRTVAAAAFTSLVNALSVSLWALLPNINLAYPAGILAVMSIIATVRNHGGRDFRRGRLGLFAFSLGAFIFQLVDSILLALHPHDTNLVDNLAYVVFAAFAAGLSRAWELLQPATGGLATGGSTPSSPTAPDPG